MISTLKDRLRPVILRRAAFLPLAGLALLFLAGCHYSLLNRGSSLAAWSPDGTQLAVCIENHDTKQSELWLVDPDRGSTTRMLSAAASSNGPPHLLAPRWSPDGTRLFCARTAEGEDSDRREADIVGIDVATGRIIEPGSFSYIGSRNTLFTDSDIFATLSDGSLVVQDLGADLTWRLVRIDPATGTGSVFADPRGNWMTISGSRRGDSLAVAVPTPDGSTTEITVHRADGELMTRPIRLWETHGDGKQPLFCWSPGGDRLAMVVEDIPPVGSPWRLTAEGEFIEEEVEDFATLMVVDPRTGRSTTVAHDLFGLPPVFSPDGTMVAYSASSGIRDVDGEPLLEVRVHGAADSPDVEYSLPGLALPLAWSADSRSLAYYLGCPENDSRGSIISVATDGSGTTVISRDQQDRLAVPAPSGGRLAWVSGDGAVQVLDCGSGTVLFNQGLTTTGTIQAAEDHLRQDRPGEALGLVEALKPTSLGTNNSARRAAVSHAALIALDRSADAAEQLGLACDDLEGSRDPAAALLSFCGALSDFGFRTEAERLVEDRLLAHYPDSPEAVEALWAIAALKQSEGDAPAALVFLQQLLQDYPEELDEPTRAVLLASLADSGENPGLVEELSRKLIKAHEGQTEDHSEQSRAAAHYALGRSLEIQGRRQEAKAAYIASLDEQAGTVLPDGQDVAQLCRQALFRLAGAH